MARISPYFNYKRDSEGNGYLEVFLRGNALLRMAATNKGTAFTEKERRELGLEGSLPPQVSTLEQQVARLYRTFIRATRRYRQVPVPACHAGALRGALLLRCCSSISRR